MHHWVIGPTVPEPILIVLAENKTFQDLADFLQKEKHPAFLDRFIDGRTSAAVGVERLDGSRKEAAEVGEVLLFGQQMVRWRLD